MTQDEFRTLIQKNKLAAGGLVFAVALFLTDMFVLRPGREARKKALLQGTQPAGAPLAEAGTPAVDPSMAASNQMLSPPPPLAINLGIVPPLNTRVESRFAVQTDYPYAQGRNVFYVAKKDQPIAEPVAITTDESVPEPVARPDITYHGFYNIGPDKIAIMRLAQRLLLTRMGQRIDESPFVLELILGNKVLIRDLDHVDGQFEVNLAEASTSKTGTDAVGGTPQGR